MALVARVDGFQQRHRVIAFPLGVAYKYFDDSGAYLAALITYYAFVSLFPLLLLGTTVLGFVLAGHPHLQQQILDSALSQFPVVGKDLGAPGRIGGGTTGLVVGILGSVYGGLGVAQAVQYAMNTAWTVPRNSRPNPFAARGRSLLLLVIIGGDVVGTTVLSAVISRADFVGATSTVLLVAGSVLLNAGVFALVFRLAAARPLTWRQVAPGAVSAAVAWQLLQIFGVFYVGHVISDASDTNSVFAVVLGLLAFLYLTGVAVVLCIEVNVVRVERLYPRALLTPFTDNVTLTRADRRSYATTAKAQRSKGFQQVDVSFHPPEPDQQPAQESGRETGQESETRAT